MFVRFTSQILLIRENNNLQKYSVLNEFSAFYRKMNRRERQCARLKTRIISGRQISEI